MSAKMWQPFQWMEASDLMSDQGTQILDFLAKGTVVKPVTGEEEYTPSLDSLNKCFVYLAKAYDDKLGGFSQAPKFPQPGMWKTLYIAFVIKENYNLW